MGNRFQPFVGVEVTGAGAAEVNGRYHLRPSDFEGSPEIFPTVYLYEQRKNLIRMSGGPWYEKDDGCYIYYDPRSIQWCISAPHTVLYETEMSNVPLASRQWRPKNRFVRGPVPSLQVVSAGTHRRLVLESVKTGLKTLGLLGEMFVDMAKDVGYYAVTFGKIRPTSKPSPARHRHTAVCKKVCGTCHYIKCPVRREDWVRPHDYATHTTCKKCGRFKYPACKTCHMYCSQDCWMRHHRKSCKSDADGHCTTLR